MIKRHNVLDFSTRRQAQCVGNLRIAFTRTKFRQNKYFKVNLTYSCVRYKCKDWFFGNTNMDILYRESVYMELLWDFTTIYGYALDKKYIS